MKINSLISLVLSISVSLLSACERAPTKTRVKPRTHGASAEQKPVDAENTPIDNGTAASTTAPVESGTNSSTTTPVESSSPMNDSDTNSAAGTNAKPTGAPDKSANSDETVFPAIIPPSPSTSKKQNPETKKQEAKVAAQDAQPAAAEQSTPSAAKASALKIAADSDEIKNLDNAKVSFKDISPLVELSLDQNKVMFKGQIMDIKKALALVTNGNEEVFCGVTGAEKIHPKDYLKVVDGSSGQIDKTNDIYKTSIVFENKNGKLSFNCTHATSHFYLEDLRTDFDKYITFVNFDNSTENEANYINPQTEDRLLHAIQIMDLAAFKKVTLDEIATEGFTLMNGKAVSVEQALNSVKAGNEQMACMIVNPTGPIDSHKIFLQVDQGISEETPREIPTASVYQIYRADKETSFIVNCVQQKKALVGEFFKMAKGVFKFGLLERKEYNQRTKELKQIQESLKKESVEKN